MLDIEQPGIKNPGFKYPAPKSRVIRSHFVNKGMIIIMNKDVFSDGLVRFAVPWETPEDFILEAEKRLEEALEISSRYKAVLEIMEQIKKLP